MKLYDVVLLYLATIAVRGFVTYRIFMDTKEKLDTLGKFRDFARIKGFDVINGSDCGQKIDGKCIKIMRIAKIISSDRIEVMEEGKGIYDVDLNDLKEIYGSLRYQELFKQLYKNKCRLIK